MKTYMCLIKAYVMFVDEDLRDVVNGDPSDVVDEDPT
jgi:hypothetical protein